MASLESVVTTHLLGFRIQCHTLLYDMRNLFFLNEPSLKDGG